MRYDKWIDDPESYMLQEWAREMNRDQSKPAPAWIWWVVGAAFLVFVLCVVSALLQVGPDIFWPVK